MAVRTDITVDFSVSPRIIEVAAPSTEVTMQDLVDTLRSIEDDLSPGMSEFRLTDATGKQPLGGGVSVGITMALQDAQVVFEARKIPAETGTHTGSSGSATQLVDSFADFVAAGVVRGSLIVNFTDGSIADVLDVVDLNTLLIRKTLTGGTDNDFDFGDAYQVWNEIQCDVTGGNLTAVDTFDAEIPPIFPSSFTQIVRTADTSASITNLDSLTSDVTLIRKALLNKMVTDPVTGVMTIFDDDSITALLSGVLFEDVAEVQKYRSLGAEVRSKLT